MKTLVKYLDESLYNSYNNRALVLRLKKIFNILDDTYISNTDTKTQFSITINKSEENLLRSEKVLNLLHSFNYYQKSITNLGDKIKVHIEPYKPNKLENHVYNKCKGIIYTAVPINVWNKIKHNTDKKKQILKPNKIKTETEFRDGRIFFVAHNKLENALSSLQSIVNTKKIDKGSEFIVLQVDLNKLDNKIIFRRDSSSSGYNAIFCEEPIPVECCNEVDKIYKM